MSCFPCTWLKKKFRKKSALTAEDLLSTESQYYQKVREDTEKQFRNSLRNSNNFGKSLK